MMRVTRREQWLLLNLAPELEPLKLRRLLEAFGDLDRLWAASPEQLQQVEGIGPRLAQRVAGIRDDERTLQEELSRAERAGVALVTLEDENYPRALRTIHDPPPVLYARGTLTANDDTAVAIVGSRHASRYGLQCAERLAYDLALRGVTVVSGLARGIDGAAHRGALNTPGRTLAVLGNGLARIYPPEHRAMAEQIVRQGALISEYPMETPPFSYNFPRRNRLISGLSLGVVVVEAAEQSGALISADCALEQGREVFAVPGPVTAETSHGTHQLLKQGARLVTGIEDILEELHLTTPHPARQAGLTRTPLPAMMEERAPDPEPHLSPSEQRVLASVRPDEPLYIDAILERSGVAMPEAATVLLQLELKRCIRQLPGKQFVRTDGRDRQR